MGKPTNEDNRQHLNALGITLADIAEYLRKLASDAATTPLVDSILVGVLGRLASIKVDLGDYESAIVTLEEADKRASNAAKNYSSYIECLSELDRLLTLKDRFRDKIRTIKRLVNQANVQGDTADKRLLKPISPEKLNKHLIDGRMKLQAIQQQLEIETPPAEDEVKERPEQSD